MCSGWNYKQTDTGLLGRRKITHYSCYAVLARGKANIVLNKISCFHQFKLYLVCAVVGITDKQTQAYLGEGKLHTTPVMRSKQEEKLI